MIKISEKTKQKIGKILTISVMMSFIAPLGFLIYKILKIHSYYIVKAKNNYANKKI